MQPGVKTLPVQQKAVAFTSSLTLQEFLELSPAVAPFLKQRYQEIRLPLADQTFFVSYPDVLNFIVLVNEESPDTWVVLPILARWERPVAAPLRASSDQPGRLAQGPDEKQGLLGRVEGFIVGFGG